MGWPVMHSRSPLMHNYWFTNYRAQQGGTLRFHYSLTSGEHLDRESLARFDADTRAPVLAYPLISSFSAKVGDISRPLPAASGSFLSLDSPNLQIVTLKAAEDEDGYIFRFREIAGRAGEAEIRLPALRPREAHLCNGVEVNQQKLKVMGSSVRVPFKANQFVTVRVKTGNDFQKIARK